MYRFDSRLALSPDETLTLKIEAIHRHSIVTEVVGAEPAASFFAPRPILGRSIVLLHPARSLVPFGLRFDSTEKWIELTQRLSSYSKLELSGASLLVEGQPAFLLRGTGVDLRISPSDDQRVYGSTHALSLKAVNHIRILPRVDDPFHAMLHERLKVLRENLFTGENRELRTCCRALIGLGIGSTPSGDDMLVGLLAALDAVASSASGETFEASRRWLRAELFAVSENQTTRTSLEMFWHAAHGYFPEALRDFVQALGNEFISKNEFLKTIGRLEALGATSGKDMMAGVLSLFESHEQRDEIE